MKYKHRGYMESDRDRNRESKKPHEPRSPEERQLRHMMERSAKMILRCHQCNSDVGSLDTLTVESTCSHCGAALHVCRSCAHLDTGSRWECDAPIVDPVLDKTTANACSLFLPNTVLDATGRRAGTTPTSGARAAFDNLFKKK